ncbi:MAG: NTP transferase domain-containing protein [Elusimicrobiota bacterium]
MKIVIPMAGRSRRFSEVGYTVPKPFIDIDGSPMIERVCRMFSQTDEFIFVCDQGHLSEPAYSRILEAAAARKRIVGIPAHDDGPLATSLAADPWMAPEDPVIVSYCDFVVRWDYRQFLMKASMADGAIAVFRGFHPASLGETKYAYLRTNERQEMEELREKESFTDDRVNEWASAGIYYVDTWASYKEYARRVLSGPERVASEFYCSLIYNPMVQDGKAIATFEVDRFICWGTPEDLEEYGFWSQYFREDLPRLQAQAPR